MTEDLLQAGTETGNSCLILGGQFVAVAEASFALLRKSKREKKNKIKIKNKENKIK